MKGGVTPVKEKLLYIVWGIMAVLCIGLGTLETEDLLLQIPLLLISIVFFVPAGLLLYDYLDAGNRKGILRIRWICIGSLAVTLVTLLAFFLAALRGAAAAGWLYEVLILVSCPMVCSQYWLVSLFLWACLLFATFIKPNRK